MFRLGFMELLILGVIALVAVRAINRRRRGVAVALLAIAGALALFVVTSHGHRQVAWDHSARWHAGRPVVEREGMELSPSLTSSAAAAEPSGGIELDDEVAVAPRASDGRSPAEVLPRINTSGARPAWIGSADGPLADGTYQVTVVTDPCLPNGPEGPRALNAELLRAAGDYIDLVGEELGETEASRQVSLPLSYIHQRLLKDTWQEPHRSQTEAIGDSMVVVHALLSFDREDQADILSRCRQAVVERRLWRVGGFGGLALLMLGSLFAYLKLDTATRGYYSGRLKLATGTVILGALTAGAMLARGDFRS